MIRRIQSMRWNSSVVNGGTKRTRPNAVITMETAKKWREMSAGERVVYATKQTSYTGVAVLGLGISATLMYLITSELFGTDHATLMYSKALDAARSNEDAKSLLGEPIKGFRQHQRFKQKHMDVFVDDKTGKKTAFMRFGISGAVNEGTVNMWLKQGERGHWEFEHLNVEGPGRGRPSVRVVLEDHRISVPVPELPEPIS